MSVQDGVEAGASTAAGLGAAAAAWGIVGNIGLAAGGGAVGVGLAPFLAVGAGVGLAAWGLVRIGKSLGNRSTSPIILSTVYVCAVTECREAHLARISIPAGTQPGRCPCCSGELQALEQS
jgi:hypothetical protein